MVAYGAFLVSTFAFAATGYNFAYESTCSTFLIPPILNEKDGLLTD
jgi:hypothetical protein